MQDSKCSESSSNAFRSLVKKAKALFIPEEVVPSKELDALQHSFNGLVSQYNNVGERHNQALKELNAVYKALGGKGPMGKRIQAARSRIMKFINEAEEVQLKPENNRR